MPRDEFNTSRFARVAGQFGSDSPHVRASAARRCAAMLAGAGLRWGDVLTASMGTLAGRLDDMRGADEAQVATTTLAASASVRADPGNWQRAMRPVVRRRPADFGDRPPPARRASGRRMPDEVEGVVHLASQHLAADGEVVMRILVRDLVGNVTYGPIDVRSEEARASVRNGIGLAMRVRTTEGRGRRREATLLIAR